MYSNPGGSLTDYMLTHGINAFIIVISERYDLFRKIPENAAHLYFKSCLMVHMSC